MSWAAHQFEIYAVQAHLPKKMVGKVSFWAIFLGDFTPDFLSKFWVYGFTFNGTHYGAAVPHQWHRGWPGMGFTHTLFFGVLVVGLAWIWKRNRAFTVGYLLGFAAHVLTDINDSVGTMLLFPVAAVNWSMQTWAYAATVDGGKYLDAAAYYSSLGLVMDLFWLVVVLFSWRVLTREYWRTAIVPADARVWAFFARFLPERGLLALYRAAFFFGVCRLISWSLWARLVAEPVIDGVQRRGFPLDLSWTGPWWLEARSLRHVNAWIALPVALALLGLVYLVLSRLWKPMGRAEAARRRVRARSTNGTHEVSGTQDST
jgi:membrane-bound metal-dependent hydrolase YbcI (DUF457 family)